MSPKKTKEKNTKEIKKEIREIPYGIADYTLIRNGNYYYVDKTQYLPDVEKAGRYLFFIRPRRFGKSLFLSMMEYYYDTAAENRFEELFKDTWIYSNQTPEKNKYLILSFNFSVVNPGSSQIESSFLNHVRGTALDFIDKYKSLWETKTDLFIETIKKNHSASDVLTTLLRLCKKSKKKLYVIIDEYDNFSNSILSSVGENAYRNMTHGTGFFRSFFNVLKAGTSGTDAPISRLFITGVSPITMDDVTSGFNIGEHLSLEPVFNRMLGFTREDVNIMLDYYKSAGSIIHDREYLMEIIDHWYGNYLFCEDDDVTMYNTDMILYFIKNYMLRKKIPNDLIDRNVRIDYGKLRHLILIDKNNSKIPTTNGNFKKLKQIIEDGGTTTTLEKAFPLEQLRDTNNFKSLLFYLGLLTIKDVDRDQLRLVIPNETVKRLYYDYIEEAYRETGMFALDIGNYNDLMSDMAYDGKWRPLMEFITTRMTESMSLRDLVTGEKSIQAFLNVYLGLSALYIIHSEKEMNKGFADIVMEPFLARYEGIRYSYMLEIKYLKSGTKPGDNVLEKLKTDAEAQLKQYELDAKFRKNIEKTTLIKLVLIFSGSQILFMDSIDQEP